MAKKSAMRQVLGFVRDVDDTVKIATGKRIHQHVSRIMDVYGPDVKQAAVDAFLKSDPPEPLDSPYRVLGIRSDAHMVVVKGSFRSWARELHPDTGTRPDPKKFQEVTEAYKKILIMRNGAKGNASG